MGDFFADLHGGGIRFPDAKFNQNGPLPPTSSPDVHYTTSKINDTSALLSGIDAYEYARDKYISDDIAYQNIPVKIQKIIPEISLPSSINTATDQWVKVTHPVDDGDLAFVLKVRESLGSVMRGENYFQRNGLGRAVDCIVNLPTVNYILRGLQSPCTNPAWDHFLAQFGTNLRRQDFQNRRSGMRQTACELFVRDCIAPLGVVIASEKQGGQHEGTNSAVDWAVNFVATICVDGFNENMVNLWRRCGVSAGDQLMLIVTAAGLVNDKVAPKLTKPPATSNLTHYYRNRVSQTFEHDAEGDLFELVPTTDRECDKGHVFRIANFADRFHTRTVSIGMWHVATSQVMSNMAGNTTSRVNFSHTRGMSAYRDDMQNVEAAALLQCTVCPVWQPTEHQQVAVHVFNHRQNGMQNHGIPAAANAFRVHNRATFGTRFAWQEPTYTGLCSKLQAMQRAHGGDPEVQRMFQGRSAHDLAIDMLAHVYDPEQGFIEVSADGQSAQFTRKFYDALGAGAGATASAAGAAVEARPVATAAKVPLFQQVAARSAGAAPALDDIAARAEQPLPGPGSKRKVSGAAGAAAEAPEPASAPALQPASAPASAPAPEPASVAGGRKAAGGKPGKQALAAAAESDDAATALENSAVRKVGDRVKL